MLLTACESGTKIAANTSSELNSKSHPENTSQENKLQAKKYPVKNYPAKKYHRKSYPGKPSAAVEMSYAINKNIVAGETIDVIVTFINTKDVENLRVKFKLDSGLSSADVSQEYHFGVLAAGETSDVKLQLSAASNGFYYMHVIATLVTESNQSRSFAIPVNVGNVNAQKHLKPSRKVTIDPSGRRVITMPAQMNKEAE